MNYEFCDGVTHTIKKGDTLYEISRKYRVPLALLLRANPYVDVFNLQVGESICVPANPGQGARLAQNMAMRPVEMENQQDTAAQQPVTMNQPENAVSPENMVGSENTGRPMMGQPSADLWRREDDYGHDYDDDHEDHDDDKDDDKEDDKDECTKSWEKYVVQPGDTLADVMADMKGDIEDFIDKNGIANVYMLPGVAYYICK